MAAKTMSSIWCYFPGYFAAFTFYVTLWTLMTGAVDVQFCPLPCKCWLLTDGHSEGAIGMKCNGRTFQKLDNFSFAMMRTEIVEELDLSGNNVSILWPNAFTKFGNLRILNLSGNQLETLQSDWFNGLGRLERLLLAENPLRYVPEKSLTRLVSLRYIDLATPYLTCDCKMRWFRRWIGKVRKGKRPKKRPRVALSESTICYFPTRLRGMPFIETTKKLLSCGGQLNPASFILRPETPRVFTKGSRMMLKCKVSTMRDDEILEWLKDGKPFMPVDGYRIQTTFEDGGRYHVTILTAESSQVEDAAEWTCRLETMKGSFQKTTQIFVLGNMSHIVCPADDTVDQKGHFLWPDTLSKSMAELPCPHDNGSFPGEVKNASRTCGNSGEWMEADTDHCDYRSSTERQLAAIRKYTSEGNKDVHDHLQRLKNVTATMNSVTADMVNSILQMMEEVAPLAKEQEEVVILDVINDLLQVKPRVLHAADQSFRTGTRMLNILRSSSIALALTEFSITDCSISRNDESGIAVAYTSINSAVENGNGLVCWPRDSQESMRTIVTNTVTMEIVIDFGAELKMPGLVVPLRFMYYRNGNSLSHLVGTNQSGSSVIEHPAIGAISNQFIDADAFIKNVSSGSLILNWPVTPKRGVSLQEYTVAVLAEDTSGPLHWTPMNSCSALPTTGRSVSFSCPLELGFYTLIRPLDDYGANGRIRSSFSLAPWVLIAGGICVSCLLSACFIHCLCRRRIHSSVKLSHALVNCWLAMVLNLLSFTLGIDAVTRETLCMVVAILLHYSTLVVLLWMFLVVRTIQRKLYKKVHPKEADASDDEMTTYSVLRPKPRHGPLVGMYFLAWGMPAMPCAFTLPLRMETYTSREDICFIDSSFMALAAFAIPASILIILISVLLTTGSRLQKELANRQNKALLRPDLSQLPLNDGLPSQLFDGPIHADSVSYVSTAIGDEEDGGARKHLTTTAVVFALTLFSSTVGMTMVMRTWTVLGLNYLDQYFLWASSGLYAATVLALGIVVMCSYVFGRRALRRNFIPPAERIQRVDKARVGSRDGGGKRRHRQRRRRSVPPTMATSIVVPIDTETSYKRDSTNDSIIDPTMDAQCTYGRLPADATITGPPSVHSGTLAPSRSNISTTRSCKVQQAVARKYYEKQRSMKMNSMHAGSDEEERLDGDTRRNEKAHEADMVGQDVDHVDVLLVDNGQSRLDQHPVDNEELILDSDRSPNGSMELSQKAGRVFQDGQCKVKPSVVLYRKRPTVQCTVAPSVPMNMGTFMPRSMKHASDEDSAPEALQCMDTKGSCDNDTACHNDTALRDDHSFWNASKKTSV